MNLFVPLREGFSTVFATCKKQRTFSLKRSSVKTFLILKFIIVIGPCVGQFRGVISLVTSNQLYSSCLSNFENCSWIVLLLVQLPLLIIIIYYYYCYYYYYYYYLLINFFCWNQFWEFFAESCRETVETRADQQDRV